MLTCAWLEEFGVCLIETLADGDEYVYCEYVDQDTLSECPKYKEFKEEIKHV